ncbi:hypothetical protein CUJ83_01505 [Methanocella sp. CWC-04]|uniref:Chloroplast import component protein (Tic20) n=1 Tax=Methanooceanicella nereidis TaxID=2052831 RepID=A0AAP2W3Z1_9EURY|nr:DUF4870 domain-containing protein [Methanocella sp. CWC-04]MCD1293670.1 hypothetical protein [Methanocella sp. CWC-04]
MVGQSPEDERLKGALAYVLTWLTGIIILIIAGDSRFLKFHAMQSIVFGIIVTVLAMVLSVICIGAIIGLLGWLYSLYGAYVVYTGREFRIPYIADFVENSLMKA